MMEIKRGDIAYNRNGKLETSLMMIFEGDNGIVLKAEAEMIATAIEKIQAAIAGINKEYRELYGEQHLVEIGHSATFKLSPGIPEFPKVMNNEIRMRLLDDAFKERNDER